jgi:hypothetical protein
LDQVVHRGERAAAKAIAEEGVGGALVATDAIHGDGNRRERLLQAIRVRQEMFTVNDPQPPGEAGLCTEFLVVDRLDVRLHVGEIALECFECIPTRRVCVAPRHFEDLPWHSRLSHPLAPSEGAEKITS